MPILSLHQARYAILRAELDGPETTALGVLLEDPEKDQLYIRLRRDWDDIAPDDPVLPLLEQDLDAKATEWGASRFMAWLEENLSVNLRTTDREAVTVEDFNRAIHRLYAKHVRTRETAATHVPLYSLRSAAGKFLENADVEPEGWEELRPTRRPTKKMFAAHIQGTSMVPIIPDGSVALFTTEVGGSRQGRLVLVEEQGSRYTLKRYTSQKVASGAEWRQAQIILEPLNNEHDPIVLTEDETRYRVIAEFLEVLY
jgi:SOS-response transcriptional repressor LexA